MLFLLCLAIRKCEWSTGHRNALQRQLRAYSVLFPLGMQKKTYFLSAGQRNHRKRISTGIMQYHNISVQELWCSLEGSWIAPDYQSVAQCSGSAFPGVKMAGRSPGILSQLCPLVHSCSALKAMVSKERMLQETGSHNPLQEAEMYLG